MPYFNVLENYGQDFQDIRPLLPGYANEVGKSGHRQEGVASIEAFLKAIFQLAKKLQAKNNAAAATTSKSVKDLIGFHESQNQHVKEANQRKLNDYVLSLRRWLSRQGASFSGEDGINWPKTMQATVMYDATAAQQGLTRVSMAGGKLTTANGIPLDTTRMVTMHSGPGAAIYVMSVEGNLHVHTHAVGHYHHSSLLAGAPVAGAGELKVTNGRITWLSNKSGHYKTERTNLLQVLAVLQKKGFSLDFALTVVTEFGTAHYGSVSDFMSGHALDNSSVRTMETAFKEVSALAKALLAKPRAATPQPVQPPAPQPQQAVAGVGNNYGSNYGNYGGNKAGPGAAPQKTVVPGAGNNYGSNYGNYGGNKAGPGAAPQKTVVPGAGNNYGSNYGNYGGGQQGAAVGNYGNYGGDKQGATVGNYGNYGNYGGDKQGADPYAGSGGQPGYGGRNSVYYQSLNEIPNEQISKCIQALASIS